MILGKQENSKVHIKNNRTVQSTAHYLGILAWGKNHLSKRTKQPGKGHFLSKSLSKRTKQPLHGFVTYQKMQGQQRLAIWINSSHQIFHFENMVQHLEKKELHLHLQKPRSLRSSEWFLREQIKESQNHPTLGAWNLQLQM
jgi:hypothetical protein